jgi:hypothetical protein
MPHVCLEDLKQFFPAAVQTYEWMVFVDKKGKVLNLLRLIQLIVAISRKLILKMSVLNF